MILTGYPTAAVGPRRTATPAINDGKWRHSAALSEIRAVFLNGEQRSVNRKVQGSNPWSGATCKFETDPVANEGPEPVHPSYILWTSIVLIAWLAGSVTPWSPTPAGRSPATSGLP